MKKDVIYFKIGKLLLINTFWLPKWLKWFRFHFFINTFYPPGNIPLHSHRWDWISIPLWGGYIETTQNGNFRRGPFNIRWHRKDWFHGTIVDKFTMTIYILNYYDLDDDFYIIDDFDKKTYHIKDFRIKYDFSRKVDEKVIWGLFNYTFTELIYSEPTLHGEELQDNFA